MVRFTDSRSSARRAPISYTAPVKPPPPSTSAVFERARRRRLPADVSSLTTFPMRGSQCMTPQVPAIEIADLTKRYGPTLAVDRLSFGVEPGRIVGFLGPNGAGKTTTLRALLGLIEPTS